MEEQIRLDRLDGVLLSNFVVYFKYLVKTENWKEKKI